MPEILSACPVEFSARFLIDISLFGFAYAAGTCLHYLEKQGEVVLPYVEEAFSREKEFDPIKKCNAMKYEKKPVCPHCGCEMQKWRVPVASTWPNEFFFVCFNDACPYYVQGWDLMWEQQKTRASYRCRLDPDTDKFVPLPVWSADALKNDIIEK